MADILTSVSGVVMKAAFPLGVAGVGFYLGETLTWNKAINDVSSQRNDIFEIKNTSESEMLRWISVRDVRYISN